MYISYGDHMVDRCGRCVGGRHGEGAPGAEGADPMLRYSPGVSVSCYIVIALCVLYAKQGWRSAVMIGQHMMSRGYPCYSCA